jgi:hypothetical protein
MEQRHIHYHVLLQHRPLQQKQQHEFLPLKKLQQTVDTWCRFGDKNAVTKRTTHILVQCLRARN